MDRKEMCKVTGKLIAKAWADAQFKAKLTADPASVLRAEGFVIPEGMRVDVLENTNERMYLVIPKRPDELSDEELDIAAAGGQNDGFSWCCY
jgi:hypothetical protein